MHGAKGGGHAKKGAVRCFEVACMAWRRGPAQLECRQPSLKKRVDTMKSVLELRAGTALRYTGCIYRIYLSIG